MNPISKKLHDKFFTDPDWKEVEKVILSYIEPLMDMISIDTTQPSEDVKAELKARVIAYTQLKKFLSDSQIMSRSLPNKSKFR